MNREQLREGLAKILLFMPSDTKEDNLAIIEAVIDYLKPMVNELIYAAQIAKRDMRNWSTSKEAATATIDVIDKALAQLECFVGGVE
jgi:hypothetical protein